MILQWSFNVMTERHIFWTAFCMLTLLENIVFGINETHLGTQSNTSTTVKPTTLTVMSKEESPTNKTLTTTTTTTTASPENAMESKNETNINSTHTVLPITFNSTATIVQLSPTQNTTSHATHNGTIESVTLTTPPTTSSTEQTKQNLSSSSNTTETAGNILMFDSRCVNIKEITTGTQVICLELTETRTCEQFEKQKGVIIRKVLCMMNTTCHIKLSESSVKHNCILLVDVNNKSADALAKVLDEKRHGFQELGITNFHKPENIENHKDSSRKTLIALVTSGLLLAFLGLAGYHLMKRRSWSPRGERLGEDSYYSDNGGHGNPATSVASQEQSDLQDKPNLNGGARENGTGQPSSKNGHSNKPHVVADTEL